MDMGGNMGADAAILPRLRFLGNVAWECLQYNRFGPSFVTDRVDFVTYFELALNTRCPGAHRSGSILDKWTSSPIFPFTHAITQSVG